MSNLPRYDIRIGETKRSYEFTSIGIKGKIDKMVSFQETNIENLYNLGFGDKDPITGEIDDMIVTNNGDTEKVLSTIVGIVFAFTQKFPNVWVYAEGSTPARTRLYQINIVKHFDELKRNFQLLCLLNGEWEEFRPNINYDAFVVRRKMNIL